MRKTLFYIVFAIVLVFLNKSAFAQDSKSTFTVEYPQKGVTIISSDTGNWGGDALGNTHQNSEPYQAEKTIEVSASELINKKYARLRIFLGLIDYSVSSGVRRNGLDESFTIKINGHSHVYQTNEPFLRGDPNGKKTMHWTDFDIPINELKAGKNVVIIHKNKSDKEKDDDFLYIGIDNTVPGGFSRMSNDSGKTWRSDDLNLAASKAPGEYMVRLVLLDENPHVSAIWTPSQKNDPHGAIGYAGEDVENGKSALDVELDTYKIDYSQPINVAVKTEKSAKIKWFDEEAKEIEAKSTFSDGAHRLSLNAGERLARVQIPLGEKGISAVQEVRFDYVQPIGDRDERINMAPIVQSPQGKAADRAPKVLLSDGKITVQNATQIAQYETAPNLRLVSLHNEYLQKNVLTHPEQTHLFVIEINDKRYGAEDWDVKNVKAVSPTKTEISLMLPDENLSAKFVISVDERKMNFGLSIANNAQKEQSWKTVFPQIGGLQLSQNADDDYYLFPFYGGVIAKKNVNLRTYYGDNSAWWQMVDLFSPEGGAGLMLRNLDTTGLYKGVAFRKGERIAPGSSFFRYASGSYVNQNMEWSSSLDAASGSTAGFEYLQRTRKPGESFAVPAAAIEMHAGDWHSAMQTYADWAHGVWKWRPFPSKLRGRWNITYPGWYDYSYTLFKDGEWQTDYINEENDIAELMSWWEWSDTEPSGIPADQVEEKAKEYYDKYKSSLRINPATDKRQYSLNRGDYDYNESWGGLPALREQLKRINDGGVLSMFYTDPVLAVNGTKLADEYGLKYAVMNPSWKKGDYPAPINPPGYVDDYRSWNMCLDTEWYQDFVMDQMTRVARDTGVDGIRYDQFGGRGFACFNPNHKHIFAEPGHNAWMQATERMVRKSHESIDKVNPDFVLTAEYPGYDFLAASLEGYLTYEARSWTYPGFRPVPLNVLRFYFPESKAFDLQRGREGEFGKNLLLWNAVGVFSTSHRYDPPRHRMIKENSDAFDGRDVTPLVPTLEENVYANRFESGDKTITVLLNTKGFTVDGPLLKADTKPNYHYVDLESGKELQPQNGAISMKLRDSNVAVIAQLPKVLSVQGNEVTLSRIPENAVIALCDAEGKVLSRQSVNGAKVLLLEMSAEVKQIKLLSGEYLTDIVEVG